MKVEIERKAALRIRVSDTVNGGHIESQTVEANLLFAILEKLEEIRMGLIAIESEITPFPK